MGKFRGDESVPEERTVFIYIYLWSEAVTGQAAQTLTFP